MRRNDGRKLILFRWNIGEHGLNVEAADFERLVVHLAAERGRVWTESFVNVAERIQAVRAAGLQAPKL
jgi:hypothetical protein